MFFLNFKDKIVLLTSTPLTTISGVLRIIEIDEVIYSHIIS